MDGLAATAALHAEAQGSDLHEPFEEYTRLVASVRLALQQRADKKVRGTPLTMTCPHSHSHTSLWASPSPTKGARRSSENTRDSA